MATPTPGRGAPTQAVATPPASTPFSSNNFAHLAISPHGLHPFVPSPQQIKKSPATMNMMSNNSNIGSFGGGYDSPSAAMALGGLAGLCDLGLDGLGGVASLRRDDEEDRRRRLEMVIEILKSRKGRVCESGIERLAQTVGLECLWETHTSSIGQRSSRTLIIAGSTLALDIDFVEDVVKKVSLTFPESPEIVTRHTDKASRVLWNDLKLEENQSPLTKMLDQFSGNLERLAALDKMSNLPELNCHEAVAGIYESLERLFKWEMDQLGEADGVQNRERTVMCTKSGKPTMHTRDKLGLSLDYWQDSWKLNVETKGNYWSIIIDCDTTSPLVYTPIRVSEHWISQNIQKIDPPDQDIIMLADREPILDWLEPENTLLTIEEPGNNHGQSGDKKFPEVMFVAKFEPPLTIPSSLAVQIFESVQSTMEMYQTTTYDLLVFPPGPTEKISNDSRSILQNVIVPVFSETGEKTTQFHRLSYNFEKIDYGKNLTELPFAHPRQLIQLLPVLRQYALMTRLLHNISRYEPPTSTQSKNIQLTSSRAEFESFVTGHPEDSYETGNLPLPVDVLVSAHPFPRLRVQFPFKKKIADVHFDIKLNGGVDIIAQNILPDLSLKQSTGKILTLEHLGRMLEITENISIWIEYVRKRLA
ncbi:hypothetical protein K3495_g1018 [Podosphaera aphanis]|nr:hypothetical protein K3495_g1018 [Podosphaera aphanis]